MQKNLWGITEFKNRISEININNKFHLTHYGKKYYQVHM